MSIDDKRLTISMRGAPPCKECSERFLACHDRCPKDERGEFGYKAWKAEIKRVNKAREEYAIRNAMKNRYLYLRREEDGK